MTFECEELVELCPRLETAPVRFPVAVAEFFFSPVTQVINQTAVVIGRGSIAQLASNFAGALAVRA